MLVLGAGIVPGLVSASSTGNIPVELAERLKAQKTGLDYLLEGLEGNQREAARRMIVNQCIFNEKLDDPQASSFKRISVPLVRRVIGGLPEAHVRDFTELPLIKERKALYICGNYPWNPNPDDKIKSAYRLDVEAEACINMTQTTVNAVLQHPKVNLHYFALAANCVLLMFDEDAL